MSDFEEGFTLLEEKFGNGNAEHKPLGKAVSHGFCQQEGNGGRGNILRQENRRTSRGEIPIAVYIKHLLELTQLSVKNQLLSE